MPTFVSESRRVDQLKTQKEFNDYLIRVTWRGSSLLREKQGDVIRMSPFQAIKHKIIGWVLENIFRLKKWDDFIDGTQKLAVKKCATRLLERGTQHQWIRSENVEKVKKIATDAGLNVDIDLTKTPNVLKVEDPQIITDGWETKINNESFVEYLDCHRKLGSHLVHNYDYNSENLTLKLDICGAGNSDCVYFYLDPKVKEAQTPQRHIYVKQAPPGTLIRGIFESQPLTYIFDFKNEKYRTFLNDVQSNIFELCVHDAIGVHKFMIDKSLAITPNPEPNPFV